MSAWRQKVTFSNEHGVGDGSRTESEKLLLSRFMEMSKILCDFKIIAKASSNQNVSFKWIATELC